MQKPQHEVLVAAGKYIVRDHATQGKSHQVAQYEKPRFRGCGNAKLPNPGEAQKGK